MTALNDGRDKDPDTPAEDLASLEDVDETCSHCGQPLGGIEGCSTPGCEGNPDTDVDDDEEWENPFEEGLLGEGDKDA